MDINKKEILSKTEDQGRWSSIRTMTYNLAKIPGQDNSVTAEYYGNRSTDYAKGATIADKAIHIIKAIFKSIK